MYWVRGLLFKILFRSTIKHLEYLRTTYIIEDADICRDNNLSEYWYGKADGVYLALKLLGAKTKIL